MTTVMLPVEGGTQAVPMQPQPTTISYQTVQAQPQHAGNGTASTYNASAAKQTGIIQVVCGLLSVTVGVIAIVMECSVAQVASPIWSGLLFFMIAGILGISSAGNQSNCLIVAHLVMSILASLAAFQMICLMIVAALSENNDCHSVYDIFGLYTRCDERYGQIAVDSIGAVIALVEFIVAIIASAICCRGSCGAETVHPQHTIVHHYVPNHGNVTIMTNPQPYGQQGFIQQAQPYSVTSPQAYNNLGYAMAPQPSQSTAVPAPPPYNYDYKQAGMPLPQA